MDRCPYKNSLQWLPGMSLWSYTRDFCLCVCVSICVSCHHNTMTSPGILQWRAVKNGGGGGPPPHQRVVSPPPSRPVPPSHKILSPPLQTHWSPLEIFFCVLCAHFPVICSMNLPIGSKLARLVSTILHFVAV